MTDSGTTENYLSQLFIVVASVEAYTAVLNTDISGSVKRRANSRRQLFM
jgi:hypothetical protein